MEYKVLLVNNSDTYGGAAKAAYRLLKGLQSVGVDASMLVTHKVSDDPAVINSSGKFRKLAALAAQSLDLLPLRKYGSRTATFFSPAWVPSRQIVKMINAYNPDIVHLHWINGGTMRIEDLKQINKPLVWSLHDMWPFTGGCHNDEGCGKYREHCGQCPILKSDREKDLSAKIFLRKLKSFKAITKLVPVALSSHMQKLASESSLFRGTQVNYLPNSVDLKIFNQFDKIKAKELLGINPAEKMLLYGALKPLNDPNKGFDLLKDSLEYLCLEQAKLYIFGAGMPEKPPQCLFPLHFLGRVNDELSMKVIYNAADVVIIPSRQEAFGQIAAEAMACGTPVVAFATSGLLDIVDHKLNGYLAEPFEAEDLARGIEWVLKHDSPEVLAEKAIGKVCSAFDAEKVSLQYKKLYESILFG